MAGLQMHSKGMAVTQDTSAYPPSACLWPQRCHARHLFMSVASDAMQPPAMAGQTACPSAMMIEFPCEPWGCRCTCGGGRSARWARSRRGRKRRCRGRDLSTALPPHLALLIIEECVLLSTQLCLFLQEPHSCSYPPMQENVKVL